jgi:MFS family permease
VWELLSDFRIYALSLVYFLFIGCVYSMIFWIPSLVKSWGIADVFRVGVYSAIPYVCGTVGMVLIGRNSDRRKERRWHFFGATVLATAGLGVTVIAQGSFAWSLTGLCIMMVGIAALTPLFFTTVSDYVPKRTAAAGIALISSLGNLGASMIPPTMMWINGTTHTPYTSLCLMMALFVISGLLLVIAIRPVRVQAPELALSL